MQTGDQVPACWCVLANYALKTLKLLRNITEMLSKQPKVLFHLTRLGLVIIYIFNNWHVWIALCVYCFSSFRFRFIYLSIVKKNNCLSHIDSQKMVNSISTSTCIGCCYLENSLFIEPVISWFSNPHFVTVLLPTCCLQL